MATDPKGNFFNRLSARARVFVLLGGIAGVLFLVYLGTLWLSGGDKTVGPSRVANAPQGLQSIPGGQLTPEYYRALMQANTQAAQQAKITGGSAIPTLVNVGNQPSVSGTGQCIICSDQSANVKSYLDDWVRQGKLSPDDAKTLQDLADKNVPVGEYAAELDQMVKAGKLTPEQARLLLEQYKKQHTNALLSDSGSAMDSLIKAGQLPLETANELLGYQKDNMSPTEYAAQLQRLVSEGKLDPKVAQQLLSQYTQQFTKEVINKSIVVLQQWGQSGQIAPDVLKELIDAENKMVPMDIMAQTLQKLVTDGRLIPAVSDKILNEYKMQKNEIGSSALVSQISAQAEAQLNNDMDALVKAGKVSTDAAAQLQALANENASPEQYAAMVNELVKQGKISPEAAQKLINDYNKLQQSRALAKRLNDLQSNNASPGEYAAELKRAVQAGLITPEQASQMMREYQAMSTRLPISTLPANNASVTPQFAAMQQRIAQSVPTTQALATPDQFAAAQTQAAQQALQDRQAHLEQLAASMSGQAQQLITAWQPVIMTHRDGVKAPLSLASLGVGGTGSGASGSTNSKNSQAATGPVLIKAGTIIFAVLDTEANSDYPSSPVMATIVEGQYKGGKLVGQLVTTKGVSGQMDRISLNFTLMNVDSWPASKAVTAYAVDPDTARTVLASQVDYHYMQRFGAIMATSFVQGYASAISSSASTTTTGIFGTSTTHPQLSPGQKLATAIGQIGTALGTVTQNYTNIPPTVRVDSGVSLGILFMADLTS